MNNHHASDESAGLPKPRYRRARWWLIRCLRLSLIIYLTLLLLLMFFEESLIFFPRKFPEGDWEPAGIDFDEVFFESADGVRLHAWHFKHPEPRGYVLFCHGNAGHLADRAWTMQMLREELNLEVFIFDYRGYGKSEGSPGGKGVVLDGRAACEEFARRAGIQSADVIPLGRSLGGAVAADVAAHFDTSALVLESTFTSILDVAAHYYPFFPVRLLMRTRLDCEESLRQFGGHLLQSHGDADEIIPYEMGQQLFAAGSDPKTFVTIEGGQHNDPQTIEFYDALDQLIDDLAGNRRL